MARPIRNLLEKGTDAIPEGPLGFAGSGNLIGAVTYLGAKTSEGLIPIGGVSIGANIESHSVDRTEDMELHTFKINAATKDAARFAAKFRSAPSNVDFLAREVDVKSIDKIKERSTFSVWEVTTVVSDRDMEM